MTTAPKTHSINGAIWTETERHERTLSNGQVRTSIHIERPKVRGAGMIYAYVIQDSGEATAIMSNWSPKSTKIPALPL